MLEYGDIPDKLKEDEISFVYIRKIQHPRKTHERQKFPDLFAIALTILEFIACLCTRESRYRGKSSRDLVDKKNVWKEIVTDSCAITRVNYQKNREESKELIALINRDACVVETTSCRTNSIVTFLCRSIAVSILSGSVFNRRASTADKLAINCEQFTIAIDYPPLVAFNLIGKYIAKLIYRDYIQQTFPPTIIFEISFKTVIQKVGKF